LKLALACEPRAPVVRIAFPLSVAEDVLLDAVAHFAGFTVDQKSAAAAEGEVGAVLCLPMSGCWVEELVVIAYLVNCRLLVGVEMAAAALSHFDDQVGAGEPARSLSARDPDGVNLQRGDPAVLIRVDPGRTDE